MLMKNVGQKAWKFSWKVPHTVLLLGKKDWA